MYTYVCTPRANHTYNLRVGNIHIVVVNLNWPTEYVDIRHLGGLNLGNNPRFEYSIPYSKVRTYYR